jgi:hypothetical protein
MAEVVKHLLCKHEALIFVFSPTKTKNKNPPNLTNLLSLAVG